MDLFFKLETPLINLSYHNAAYTEEDNTSRAEIHWTSDIDKETSQCPVNAVKTPDKMSNVFNVQPLKLYMNI